MIYGMVEYTENTFLKIYSPKKKCMHWLNLDFLSLVSLR